MILIGKWSRPTAQPRACTVAVGGGLATVEDESSDNIQGPSKYTEYSLNACQKFSARLMSEKFSGGAALRDVRTKESRCLSASRFQDATGFVIQMTGFVIRIFLCIFYAYSVSILVGISYSNHIPIIAHIVQHIPAYSIGICWNMPGITRSLDYGL